MHKLAAYAALGLAGALLSLQCILALEYTAGGTFGTQASMIGAMVTLAALPVFIEAARYTGHRGIAAALFVAFLAFLAYSLPATTGRTGEVKETKVTAASDVAGWRSELESLNKQLNWHREQKNGECVGAPEPLPPLGWPKCRSHTAAVTSYEERIEKLEGKVSKVGPAAGDMGSDLWAWATGLSAATVRKGSILAFAIGLDMAIWSLIWLATSLLIPARRAQNDNRPAVTDTAQTSFPVPEVTPPSNGGNRRRVYTKDAARADVIQLVTARRSIPTQDTLSQRWGVGKGTVSKWLASFEDDGLICRETIGRCKRVAAA